MNRSSNSLLAALFLWSLSACASEGGANMERMIEACQAETNMGPALCQCVAEKACDELSPQGFELLLASLEGNEQAANDARAGMPVDQVMKAGTFLTRAPAECAQQ